MQNFQALGAPPPDARASGSWGLCPQSPVAYSGWGLRPQTHKQPSHCEFLATRLPLFVLSIIIWIFVAFVLNNFFLIVQLQTL